MTRTFLDWPPDEIASHEASHHAMAAVLDVAVGELSVVPRGAQRGIAWHGACPPLLSALILLAPLVEDAPTWPVSWAVTGDEADLRDLITEHHLTRETYDELVVACSVLVRSALYRETRERFTAALKRTPDLTATEAARIANGLDPT
jgi:hypothetical protein